MDPCVVLQVGDVDQGVGVDGSWRGGGGRGRAVSSGWGKGEGLFVCWLVA